MSTNNSINKTGITNTTITSAELDNFVVGANTSINSTDTVLEAFEKTQGQINALATTPAPVTSVNGQTGAVLLDTDDINEGATNLYYTSTRFNTSFAGKTTSDLTEGTNLYYTSSRFNSAFSGKTTTDLNEGTNLYYTNARGIGSTLTGFTSGAGIVNSSDNILQGMQKIDGNVSNKADSANPSFSGTMTTSGDIQTTKAGITTLLSNTSDGSDNKAVTMGGGGAYNVTRGSGIALIGNEYATVGGDLELLAGDSAISGAIKFYVGDGAGGARLAGKIERTTGAFHIGTSGTNTGTLIFNGATSGGVTMKSANAAGTWTMTLPTSAGTSGQVLQTDGSGNTSWATVSGGNSYPEEIYAASSATLLFYSDVDTYTAEVISLTTLSLYYSGGQERFLSGVAQQVSASTIWASATRMTSAMIRGGYVYVYIDSGATARIYRCLLTNDISASGNWTQLTISGTTLPVGQLNCLLGYGDGKFWISHYATNYIPYTLSGTTLTSGTPVTITSSSYRGDYARVNDNGIYAAFGVGPYVRFASFAGTVDTTKQCSNSQRPAYALSTSFYLQNPNATTIYSLIKL